MFHRITSRSVPKLALAALVTGGLAAVPAADGGEASSLAYLTSDVIVPDPTVSGFLTLRSTPGALALVVVGGSPAGIPLSPILPVLRVGPPYVALPAGVVGADGRFRLPFSLTDSVPAGVSLHVQGFADTPAGTFGSEPLELTPVGGEAANFVSAPGQLPATPSGFLTGDVDFCDVDKDGDQDALVIAIGEGERPVLLINDGTGSFSDESLSRLPAAVLLPLSQVEFADVNGDGWDDMFLAGRLDELVPARNWLLINDGAGGFEVDEDFPAGLGRTIDAEFGDLDGDGDYDLVMQNLDDPVFFDEHPDGVTVYLNQGGDFTEFDGFGDIPFAQPHYGGGSISLGDIDNDGDLDLFVARSNIGAAWQNRLYQNDGTGVFTDVTDPALPPNADNSFEAQFVDLNGNGWLDIVVANSVSSAPGLNVYINAGGGPEFPAFVDGNVLVPDVWGDTTNVRVSLDVGDIDRDGDQDIVAGIHGFPSGPFPATDGEPVLLVNQGGIQGGFVSTFEVDESFLLGHSFIDGDLSFADVDNDGDLDVYVANSGDILELLPPVDLLLINDL